MLTTAGDHVFKAMVAASIFGMCGPQARACDDALTARLVTDTRHGE